ncbi:MAG: helix-turn-helix transcriptional regulator [Oscillospiraceae bacterium]|nr:helix-turn-helix transcriptional regulator [Oscillospiraceae bacterium]
MIFREKLVQLRKSRNLTQEQLAEALGVSRQAVSRWEAGDSTPDMINLLGLCDLFGVSSDYLIHDNYQSDDDMPIVKEKNERISEVKFKKKVYHLYSAIGFTIAIICSCLSVSLSNNDIQFAISIFTCATLSFCATVQYYLYFKER